MNELPSVIELFTLQALASPQAIAVFDRDETITYGELNKRADKIAFYLKEKNVEADTLVPIVLENGIDIISSILGILKAGAAFIPIDPSYPEERITYILQDSQCYVAISNSLLASKLSSANSELLLLDQYLSKSTVDFIPSYTYPDPIDLAYVIYTSGSTGKPKGVMVEHRQLSTYLVDVVKRFELDKCKSFAILGTFSADAGYTAVFAALCFGKRLTVINIKELSNFEQLVERFKISPVDCYKTTPSLMQLFLQNREGFRVLPLKKLILGGESCPWTLAKDVFSQLPAGCKLYNHYGPTETTIGVITYEFPKDSKDFPAVISLGKPLDHVVAHVLTEKMDLTPVGSTGDLYIEGPLVARGYLQKPALTSERFVFINIDGQRKRLYKTGDIVRMLVDGNIEYVGRSDDQVKIFGNRIELKEIEQVILESGLVNKCAVLAKKNEAGAIYLLGYITLINEFSTADLIALLQQKLPVFMVPYKWVNIDKWPLTFNNKIDRKALPGPELVHLTQLVENNYSVSPLEFVLIGIWERTLNTTHVKRLDHFFELGGNSLQLVKLCFEISNQLQVEVTVVELFGCLTIQQMATYLSAKQKHLASPHVVPDGFDKNESSATQRNMFIQNLLNPALNFPNSSISFEVCGELDIKRLESAIKKIISTNESLRTAFYMSGGKVYKQISTDIEFSIRFIDAGGNDIDGEIISLTEPYNFKRLPLIRFFIVRLIDGLRFLHLDMPHINSDGESLKIIIRDIAAIYNNIYKEKASLQYTDFQRKQYAYHHSDQFKADEDFWRQQLSDDVPLLQFGSKQKLANAGLSGAYYVTTFSPDILYQIDNYIKSSTFTKFQLLLCAYCVTMCRITSSSSVMVMAPVHNRNEQGMGDVIGLLSNVVLMKNEVVREESIKDYLMRSRNAIVNILSHQRFPFEKQLEIWKEKGRNIKKLYNSFFGYHNSNAVYKLGDASLKLYIPSR
ncbi:MAG: amino acid adenylation domain-containing protein, partial [Chitinophagaceae bacterium]